ncbi:MAG: BppU family phage baseplate upper protein [Clostridia bacterium]|nr:BppU family phage baseplate upper protein [Clostridia bacterium]
MASDITTIKMDINEVPPRPLVFKQKDNNSRVLIFELTDDGVPLDLTDCNVSFFVKMPDESVLYQRCEVIDEHYGQIRISLSGGFFSMSGAIGCEIVIISHNSVLSSRRFCIDILPSLYDDEAQEV